MGFKKTAKWLIALKRVFSLKKDKPKLTVGQREASATVEQKTFPKEKKRWSFWRSLRQQEAVIASRNSSKLYSFVQVEEQNKHALAVAVATAAAAAEAAVVAAQAAVEVVRLTNPARKSLYPILSREEWATIKIQTAFRGYMARRALRALKGLVRVQALVRGYRVRKHTTLMLRCMQALISVQKTVQARRERISQENEAIKTELLQRRKLKAAPKSLPDSSEQREWNYTKEPVEIFRAKLQKKKEAAEKRERSLAYANQLWRSVSKSSMPFGCEPDNKPQFDLSWLEKWMATQQWGSQSAADAPSEPVTSLPVPNPVSKRTAKHAAFTSPRTPILKGVPKHSLSGPYCSFALDEGASFSTAPSDFSLVSAPSKYLYRRSVAGSSVRDDESLASYSGIPNFMAITESAKAKARSHSTPKQRPGVPDKECLLPTRRRLAFQQDPLISNSSPLVNSRRAGPQRSPSIKGSLVETRLFLQRE